MSAVIGERLKKKKVWRKLEPRPKDNLIVRQRRNYEHIKQEIDAAVGSKEGFFPFFLFLRFSSWKRLRCRGVGSQESLLL